MSTYYAKLLTGPRHSARAFNYDSAAKELVAVDSRVEFETGEDYFAVKIAGDYAMLFDADGLLIGDYDRAFIEEYPRLEFTESSGGVRHHLASLTADGRLATRAVRQSDTLPTGLNLWDSVVLHRGGITATQVNEVWFLAHDGNYVTAGGLLIRVGGV